MPRPQPNEDKSKFIQRCIRAIRKEDGHKDMDAVLGKCYGLWRQHKGGK